MQMLRTLILLILFSAIANAATAQSSTPIDGYHDVAPAHLSILMQNQYEGDEPEVLVSQPGHIFIVRGSCPGPKVRCSLQRTVYADYLSRAPPLNL